MTGLELRTFGSRLELRVDGDMLRFSGYASTTGNAYDFGAGFRETIVPGAFRDTLRRSDLDVVMLADHEGLPVARTPGSLRLSEDARGLRVDADLDPQDPEVRRIATKLNNGSLRSMSFAFRVPDGGDTWNKDYTERKISRVDLHHGDVSVVGRPANDQTTAWVGRGALLPAEVRSLAMAGHRPAMVDAERFELYKARAFVLGLRGVGMQARAKGRRKVNGVKKGKAGTMNNPASSSKGAGGA